MLSERPYVWFRAVCSMQGRMLDGGCGLSAQCAIGATRCDDKCESTVLLENQWPCGNARKCSADTVTDDTSAQVKMSYPELLASLSQDHQKNEDWPDLALQKNACRGLRNSEPVESEYSR